MTGATVDGSGPPGRLWVARALAYPLRMPQPTQTLNMLGWQDPL